MPSDPPLRLLDGSRLAHNIVWNLLGSCAPMLVAVFSMPVLIRELGKERFGVLALAWALVGYASLFDIGLGRALTQLVAKKLGAGEVQDVSAVVWSSLILMLTLASLGTTVVVLISPCLVERVLKVPEPLQVETLHSFYLLGISLPLVTTTSGLRGLLEAYQRFGLINALRIPMGVFTFASPLLTLPFSRSLVPMVAVLVLGRFLALVAHLVMCLQTAAGLRHGMAWHRPSAAALLSFGGWMTVSNVISPLMVTLDRFFIGALVSITAVTYYATPFEVVTKLLIIPAAVMGVMFPAFSCSFAADPRWTAVLYARCVKYLLLLLLPTALVAIVLARNGLTLWLGDDFAQHSARVWQWLCAGVFLNCLAQVPFALVQGVGRPDLTAKLHALEFPCYLLALGWLVSRCGIEGAAIAWTGRAAVDALALFALSRRFLPTDTRVALGSLSCLLLALLTDGSASMARVVPCGQI